jgi:hypothetical protein
LATSAQASGPKLFEEASGEYPMSESERYQAYLAALNEASQVYGFQVSAQVQSEALGPVVQVRAVVTILAMPNWQPSASSPVSQAVEAVKPKL